MMLREYNGVTSAPFHSFLFPKTKHPLNVTSFDDVDTVKKDVTARGAKDKRETATKATCSQ